MRNNEFCPCSSPGVNRKSVYITNIFIGKPQVFINSSENTNRFCQEWQINKGLGTTIVLFE